jgi:hypothetical protein
MSEKSLKKADFWSKNQKDMSHDGTYFKNKYFQNALFYVRYYY